MSSHWKSTVLRIEKSAAEVYACLQSNGDICVDGDWFAKAESVFLVKGSFNPIHNGHVALYDAVKARYPSSFGAFSLSFNTAKGHVTVDQILGRSLLIHKAGFPVVISKSGRFSHNYLFLRRRAPDLRIVFALGRDVLSRLIEYYSVSEFDSIFADCIFEYCGCGESVEPLSELHVKSAIHFLGPLGFSWVSSSKIRNLLRLGDTSAIAGVMPSRSCENYIAQASDANRRAERQAIDAAVEPDSSMYFPDPATINVAKAEGCHLYLDDRRKLLDAAGGSGVINVGYGRPEVANAMTAALRSVSYALPRFATPQRRQLIELLRDKWLPAALSRVQFTATGTEAIETAIMVARKFQIASGRVTRWKVIGRNASYHGATLQSLSLGDHAERRQHLNPLLTHHPRCAACYCLRCDFNMQYPTCELACAQDLETIIGREGADTVAAFVAEPVVGFSGGAIVPPEEYWPTVLEICQRNKVLLIADEIVTGFGRTGERFAINHWNIEPDILVIGKGMTGGYAPLAAVCTTSDVDETIRENGFKLPTQSLAGHPAACAAAIAVLEILEREDLIHRASALGRQLGELLHKHLSGHPHVGEIRGMGLLWGIELVQDRSTLRRFPEYFQISRLVTKAAMDLGVFAYPGGTGEIRDIVVIAPPFIISYEQLSEIVTCMAKAIDRVMTSIKM